MKEVRIKDEYIKLCQALKFAGMVENGADAKFEIQDGLVKVNGEVELQRGKKLRNGDIVEYHGEEFTIVSPFK
ncbi:MAG: RNA-binding S4 domain-containing protein [Lachnospiraceae bacterium]|nr:RNA-binding S4 domain-containing protein [Lachnospiraceae bacterium]